MTSSRVTGDGVVEWRDAQGRLHREGGPARVFPSGRRIRFVEGVKLREARRSD